MELDAAGASGEVVRAVGHWISTLIRRHIGKSRQYVPARPTDQPATSRAVKNGVGARRAKPAAPPRIVILEPGPVIDGGRFAPKRTAGEAVTVRATIFADGHDVLRAVVKVKAPGGRRWL